MENMAAVKQVIVLLITNYTNFTMTISAPKLNKDK